MSEGTGEVKRIDQNSGVCCYCNCNMNARELLVVIVLRLSRAGLMKKKFILLVVTWQQRIIVCQLQQSNISSYIDGWW